MMFKNGLLLIRLCKTDSFFHKQSLAFSDIFLVFNFEEGLAVSDSKITLNKKFFKIFFEWKSSRSTRNTVIKCFSQILKLCDHCNNKPVCSLDQFLVAFLIPAINHDAYNFLLFFVELLNLVDESLLFRHTSTHHNNYIIVNVWILQKLFKLIRIVHWIESDII